ncbi:TPA: hypothetical protein N0F65_009132, partial [Lagenidium giganteum]
RRRLRSPCAATRARQEALSVCATMDSATKAMEGGGYEFSAAPRSVANKRIKPRENGDRPQNIMYDKRVHRGSAYITREETPEASNKLVAESRNTKAKSQNHAGSQQRPITPPPLDGRSHMDIQTDNYLEELTDRNPEVDVDTQTDALLDLHPPVTFIPSASGVDVSTQIENGDLFDFDLEVEPILEVLVGKTLEIGMLEVLEEQELQEIRHRQELFEQSRNAELAEVQRLEAEAKRKYAEKQRRLDEEKKRLQVQAELEEKVAARAYAKNYLGDLHTQVFGALVDTGYFFDPIFRDVRDQFLPEVVDRAAAIADGTDTARKLLDGILLECLKRRP